jgi:hypothetical protein
MGREGNLVHHRSVIRLCALALVCALLVNFAGCSAGKGAVPAASG